MRRRERRRAHPLKITKGCGTPSKYKKGCPSATPLLSSAPGRYSEGRNLRLAGKIEWWENARIMMTRKRLPVLLFLLCIAAPLWTSLAAAQETLRYAVVSNGKTQGSEVDVFGSDGRIDSTFEFNDRGRGPKISAHYMIGANGTPSHTDVTGNDYLKAPVDEHFAVENENAHWKSTSEDGKV